MMPNMLKSKKGFIGAMMVVAIAVVVGVIIVGVVSKMGSLNKSYDKSRAFFDSEMAIEKFATALKIAYDKANYLKDVPPQTAGTAVKDDYGCPGKIVNIGTGAEAVRLCWEYGSGLCSKRSLNAGLDICLDPGNLQVSILSPTEWMVAYEAPPKTLETQWEIFKQATREIVNEIAFPQAQANLDTFTPAIPATASKNSIPINLALLNRPEAPTCAAGNANPFLCLKVAFCVKNGSSCDSKELIRQTYLFAKPASTTQGY